MATVEVLDDTFETLVLKSPLPVLVDFWAPWCAPCKMVAPILEELSETYAGRLTIAKVDVDRAQMVAMRYRIQSIPTMALFVDGQPVQAVQGALPKEALIRFIEQHVPEGGGGGVTITVDELAAAIDRKIPLQVFDVREQNDFSRSHLLGAQCVSVDDLKKRWAEEPPEGIAVLICRTGERSKEAAKELRETLGERVVALEKGLLEWEGSGRPTYSDREERALQEA